MTRLGLKQKLTTTQLLFRYSSVQLVQEKKNQGKFLTASTTKTMMTINAKAHTRLKKAERNFVWLEAIKPY